MHLCNDKNLCTFVSLIHNNKIFKIMNTIDFSRFHSCLTHDGVFHADEVTARVLVERAGFKGDFIRSRNATILETSLHDPNTLVLD